MAYVDTPIPTDDLDVSQPQIRTNFSSADASMGQDHYGFSDTSAKNGLHKQVRIPAMTSQAVPTNPASVVYTAAGIEVPASPNLLYQNQQYAGIPIVLNAVRAFAAFQGRFTNGACTLVNGSGLSATRTAAGNYNVQINSGLLNPSSSNYCVLVSCTIANNFGTGANPGYVIVSPTSLNLNFKQLTVAGAGFDPDFFTVAVLQV